MTVRHRRIEQGFRLADNIFLRRPVPSPGTGPTMYELDLLIEIIGADIERLSCWRNVAVQTASAMPPKSSFLSMSWLFVPNSLFLQRHSLVSFVRLATVIRPIGSRKAPRLGDAGARSILTREEDASLSFAPRLARMATRRSGKRQLRGETSTSKSKADVGGWGSLAVSYQQRRTPPSSIRSCWHEQ